MLSGRHKKRTVHFWTLWDEIFSTQLNKNKSNEAIIRHAPYYMDLKGFYSDDENVTYMYTIDGYPSELEISYRTTLRKECREGVRMSFVSTFEKHRIDWTSPQMKSKLRTWKILEKDTGEVDEYNLHENMALLDSQEWRKESLTYLSDAEIRRKRKMFKFRSVMFVSGKRGEAFDETITEVVAVCKALNIKLTRVMLNIQDYLNVFSPFSLQSDPKLLENVGSNVLTDELLARFNTYSQGTVGKEGLYWGTDIYSSFPCLKPVKQTTESAENWLITAETGGGKSFFVKGLLLQLLASKYYNGTIMDIEGFEYLPIAYYLSDENKVVVLNMAEGVGAYFDPVEIIQTGDPELDRDMHGLSTSFTLSIFKTLLGTTDVQDEWVDIVINDAVSLTYTKAGVFDDDMASWKNSKGLTLFSVYDTLKTLLTDGDAGRAVSSKFSQSLYEEHMGIGMRMSENDVNRLISTNEGYQKAVEMCLAKVSRYFENAGTRSSVFKKRVDVQDIISAKLVVCSFGMAGKSEKNVDPIQMALSQLCTANISYLRSVFSKHEGKYNFKLWEEFQRWGGFPDSEKTITTALTGGRKLGDINIIVTNKVKEMLDNDRFGVFSNITSIAIGCIWDAEVREDLCQRLSIQPMLPELHRLVAENKNLSAYSDGDTITANPYNKAFLIGLDKTVYALARMSLPTDLATSSMFRTGISIRLTEDGEMYEYQGEEDEYGEDNAFAQQAEAVVSQRNSDGDVVMQELDDLFKM